MNHLIKRSPSRKPIKELEKIFSGENIENPQEVKNKLIPSIDVQVDNEKVIICLQVSGINPGKLNIFVENDILYLRSGEVKAGGFQNNDDSQSNIFSRSIPLPARVDSNLAIAKILKDELRIIIPKIKIGKSIKIKVKEL